jgi:hypothetical protein
MLYKTTPLKNTRGSFGHVEIYNKIEYFWNIEYAGFYKMAYFNNLLVSIKTFSFV